MDKIKNKVLQELIDMMDSKMTDGMKSKSPKFMKVETNDPVMAKGVVENVLEDKMENPMDEMKPKDISEDLSENENPFNESDNSKDDDMNRLMEMYKKLK